MRNILVPQVGQVPWVAGLPFFMVIFLAFFISFLKTTGNRFETGDIVNIILNTGKKEDLRLKNDNAW